MSGRAITYAEQQEWRRAEHDLFRHIGELLRDVIPSSAWCELDIDALAPAHRDGRGTDASRPRYKATDTASVG